MALDAPNAGKFSPALKKALERLWVEAGEYGEATQDDLAHILTDGMNEHKAFSETIDRQPLPAVLASRAKRVGRDVLPDAPNDNGRPRRRAVSRLGRS